MPSTLTASAPVSANDQFPPTALATVKPASPSTYVLPLTTTLIFSVPSTLPLNVPVMVGVVSAVASGCTVIVPPGAMLSSVSVKPADAAVSLPAASATLAV